MKHPVEAMYERPRYVQSLFYSKLQDTWSSCGRASSLYIRRPIIHVTQVTRKHRGVAAAEEPPLRDTWADWLLKLYKLIWSRVSGPLFDSTKSPQIAENAPLLPNK